MSRYFRQIPLHFFTVLVYLSSCSSQSNENRVGTGSSASRVFVNPNIYEVSSLPQNEFTPGRKVKNIILMIGDGMGLTQVNAGMVANRGNLNLQNCTYTGLAKTAASDNDITDSAAAATAYASGIKTYNGAIGVDDNGTPVKTILEIAEENGKSTGLVATCRITHATPASFISHQSRRSKYQEIAADFLKTDIDVFIGGGKNDFTRRKDGNNLLDSLKHRGYQVLMDDDSLQYIDSGKLAALIHDEDQRPYSQGRGEMLGEATRAALRILSKNENGFFLMIEGSQIDWGGHENNTSYLVEEMLDFDRAIGEVLSFAAEDGETLVIITADHETGGFAVVGGDVESGAVEGSFSTHNHTGIMVPVYSYGPSAETFSGIYENTEIFFKMMNAAGFK